MNGFTLNGFTRVGQKIHGKCSACGRAVKMDAEGWLNDCPEDCPLAVFRRPPRLPALKQKSQEIV